MQARTLRHTYRQDIAAISALADPFPALDELRAAGPVVPVRVPFIGRAWLTTTHAAAEAMLKDKVGFVSEGTNAGVPGIERFVWWMPGPIRLMMNNMLLKDEPDHGRLRRLVNAAFERRGIAAMAGAIAELADRRIDAFGSGPVDLVADYARLLPLDVISELLGLPEEHRADFAQWTRAIAEIAGPASMVRMMGGLGRLVRYIRTEIEASRQAPRPGLISGLVAAEADGDRLSEDELIAMVASLLVAGYETTTHLIAGGLHALETHPDRKAWLLADPDSRIGPAVEELLRYCSPVQTTKQRFVACDTVFQGQSLRRGELILAHLGAANSDPAVFADPHSLQLDRFPNPHIAFGSGIHFCLGLQLARLEARIAIARLYARCPGLVLQSGGGEERMKRFGLRGFRRLVVDAGGLARSPSAR